MQPLAITAHTATTAVGRGVRALEDALRSRRSGLAPNRFTDETLGVALPTWIGRVDGLEEPLPAALARFDARNNRLAWIALHEDDFLERARHAIARHGASRVAVFVGTSTSTIAASEAAYRDGSPLDDPTLHHLHATTAFVQSVLGATGPAATVSTACSSSAKVFAQAARAIEAGWADAAVVGGVDSLAASTLFGFHSLGLVSRAPCRPFDRARDGISVGEAGGFALLERPVDGDRAPLLVGYGESSDAHHMSAPHPEGTGARRAIALALASAGLTPRAVDYLNLHGTATPKNDAVEAALVAALFPTTTHAGSTKGWTGHALGAAGVVEAVATLIALESDFTPGTLQSTDRDDVCGPQIRFDNESRASRVALSHAFAFGGSNCVLAFARHA